MHVKCTSNARQTGTGLVGHGRRTTVQLVIKYRWAGVSINIGGPRWALRALSGSMNISIHTPQKTHYVLAFHYMLTVFAYKVNLLVVDLV